MKRQKKWEIKQKSKKRRNSTTHALLVFIFFLQRIIIRLSKLHLCCTEKHVLHFMKMIILILIEKMNRKKKKERWKFVEVCLSVHLSFFSYFSIFFSQFLIQHNPDLLYKFLLQKDIIEIIIFQSRKIFSRTF